MKRMAIIKTSSFRYTLFGFLFGCIFPIAGTIMSIWINQEPFNWASFIDVQRNQILLWIIDTAPLFLGFTFGIAGKREDSLLRIKASLEDTVAERTSELQKINLELQNEIEGRHNFENRLKASVDELQLISEVARSMSKEKDIEQLLPMITKLVSERFGFYHVGIFLIDNEGEYAVLRASNSVEGHNMLNRGHRLKVGQVGIVGNVAATGTPRIASEVDDDDVFFDNPYLPETQSEMALPLITGEKTIGIIDVQSKEPNVFTNERVNTLSILADQVTIAIENSRLFSEIQQALSASQAFSRQYNAQAWARVAREQQLGYLYTTQGGKEILEPLEWEEAHKALNEGKMVISSPDDNEEQNPALAIPLHIREQTIGVIDIRSKDPNHQWRREEINIIQAIADRVGLALENARLFEETTSRANRERAVSDITTRVRSFTDPQLMLQTALDGLKQALGTNDIRIRPFSSPLSLQDSQQPVENKSDQSESDES